MRENRQSGSEGGGAGFNRLSLPLFACRRSAADKSKGCKLVALNGELSLPRF